MRRKGTDHLLAAVPTIKWGEGLVLRYGGFYGPRTAISQAPDAPMAAPIRKRWFPIIGDGGGIWSHVHIDDAAAATAAIDRGEPGIYNIATTSRRRCESRGSSSAKAKRARLAAALRELAAGLRAGTRRAVTDQHRLGRGQVLGPHPGRRAPQELIYRPTLHV